MGDGSIRLIRAAASASVVKTLLMQSIAPLRVSWLGRRYVAVSVGLDIAGVILKLVVGIKLGKGIALLSAGGWANSSSFVIAAALQTSSLTPVMKVVTAIPSTVEARALVLEIDATAIFPAVPWVGNRLAQFKLGKRPRQPNRLL